MPNRRARVSKEIDKRERRRQLITGSQAGSGKALLPQALGCETTRKHHRYFLTATDGLTHETPHSCCD